MDVVVTTATRADVDFILGWLEREYEEDGEGFWCNRRLIVGAIETDELTVVREMGEAVAFQVGRHEPNITSVRKDRRGQGYGTALFKAGLRRAVEDNVNLLNITCAPASSWTFWRRFGFEVVGPVREWGETKARLIVERQHELPNGASADVEIAFFPEDAIYGREEPVEPFAVHCPQAVRSADGPVLLAKRVIGVKPDGMRGDLVIRILVDGKERCFCKAKYEGAESAGVIRNSLDGTYYLDEITA